MIFRTCTCCLPSIFNSSTDQTLNLVAHLLFSVCEALVALHVEGIPRNHCRRCSQRGKRSEGLLPPLLVSSESESLKGSNSFGKPYDSRNRFCQDMCIFQKSVRRVALSANPSHISRFPNATVCRRARQWMRLEEILGTRKLQG